MSVTGDEDDRPHALSVQFGGTLQMIDLHTLSIFARFQAKGQINARNLPHLWNPEWEGAELLLYMNDQGKPNLSKFSVLWRFDRRHLQIVVSGSVDVGSISHSCIILLHMTCKS